MRRITVVVSILLVLGAAGWWGWTLRQPRAVAVQVAGRSLPDEQGGAADASAPVVAGAADDDAGMQERQPAPAATAGISLLVQGNGLPVSGARLLLQPGDGRLRAGSLAKHAYLRSSEGRALVATSDAQGRMILSDPLDTLRAAARSASAAWWIVADGWRPLRAACEDDARLGLPAVVVLERADPVLVRVRRADGGTAAAARVLAAPRAAGTSPERRAVPGTVVESLADAEGSAVVARLEPGMVVWAESETTRSLPVPVADRESSIELVLLPTFRLQGRVDWTACDAAEPAAVVAKLVDGSRVHDLGAVPVRVDGSYGPVDLPVVPCERLYANVDAGDALCDALIVEPAPAAGAVLEHAFAMRPALWAPMLVYDSEKRPIEGALVKAVNRQGPHKIVVEGATGSDGRLRLGGLAAGQVEGTVAADGHAPFLFAFNLHRSGQLYEIPLAPGARLSGRVLRAGSAVREFQLHWNDPSGAPQSKSVSGSLDGSFELSSLPAAPLEICATADDGARSAWMAADPRGAGELLLELDDGARLAGTVRAKEDGRPLADVELQLVARTEGRMAGAYGRVVKSDAAGRFELRGARALDTQLVASLEGRMDAGLQIEARHLAGDGVDLVMAPSATLELTVEPGPWRGEGLLVHMERGLLSAPVGPDGSVRFTGLPVGRVEALVEIGDLQLTTSRLFELRAGVVNRERIDLGAQPRLRIEFSGGAARSPLWTLEAWAGELRSANSSRPDTTFDLMLPGVPCQLLVSDMQGVVLARNLDAAAVAAGVLKVRVPDEPGRVRMVDHAGAAVALRTWVVLQQGDPGVQRLVVAADDRSEFAPPFEAGTTLRALGTDLATRVAVADAFEVPAAGDGPRDVAVRRESPLVFVSEGDGDGGKGLALELRVDWIPDALVVLKPAAGADARLEAVSAGRYSVSWSGEEVWSGSTVFTQTEAGARVPLDLRGLGALELELRRDGRPAAGAALELVDEAGGEAVGAWLARGAAVGALRAGEDGVVRLARLPRGSYRWRAADPGLAEAGGVVEVRARRVARFVLDIP